MIDISLMLNPNSPFWGHLSPAPSYYVYTIESHVYVILLHTFRLAISNYSHTILQQYHTPNTCVSYHWIDTKECPNVVSHKMACASINMHYIWLIVH